MTLATSALLPVPSEQEMASGACPHCGVIHTYPVCFLLPKIVPLCDSCAEIQDRQMHVQREHDRRRNLFLACLPSGYHGATRDKVPAAFQPIFGWNEKSHHGGLGLIGQSGLGKSHAIACLLRLMNQPFRWWSGTDAREAATQAATAQHNRDEAIRRWETAKTLRLLVIDDISQGVMTAAWSSKLFDLLEGRLGNGLPTLWTSQLPLDDLRQKIIRQNGGDAEQASAISRRLGQHSLLLGGGS